MYENEIFNLVSSTTLMKISHMLSCEKKRKIISNQKREILLGNKVI